MTYLIPVFAAALSFSDALTQLTAASLDVKKQHESEATAKDRLNQAAYKYWPTVNANAKSQLSGNDPGGRDTTRSADVTLGVNLYKFGGDQAKGDQAEATARQTALQSSAAAADAEANAALALLTVIELDAELTVEQFVLDARRSNVEMARKLYTRGVRSAQDIDKVAIDAANDEARLSDTEVRRARAQADVDALAGAGLSVQPAWPWTERFRAGSGKLAALTPDFTARADRQALAARVAALDAASLLARSGRLPSLDASVDYGYTHQDGPDVVPYQGRGWSGTLTLTAPLFDRLSAATDQSEQGHLRNAAALDLEQKDRALKTDWEATRTAFTKAVSSATQRDKTLATARDLYQHSLKSFQTGLLSANELSLDESRLHDAELLAVEGWSAAHQSFVKLCRSLDKRIADCVALTGP